MRTSVKKTICLLNSLSLMLICACKKTPIAKEDAPTPQAKTGLEQNSPQESELFSLEEQPLAQETSLTPVIVPIHNIEAFDGSIISTSFQEDGTILEERRHRQELSIFLIADTNVYESPSITPPKNAEPLNETDIPQEDAQSKNGEEEEPAHIIGSIGRGQNISIYSIIKKSFPLTTANSDDFWLKIAFQDTFAYLHIGALKDPYDNDQWLFLETLQVGNDTWYIQKCEASVLLDLQTPLYAFPGAQQSVELFETPLSSYIMVNAIALKETNNADNGEEIVPRWVRVVLNENEFWTEETFIQRQTALSSPYTIIKNQLQG